MHRLAFQLTNRRCAVCHKRLNRRQRVTCCNKCSAVLPSKQATIRAKVNGPRKAKALASRPACAWCGKRVERRGARFCNRRCYHRWARGKPKPAPTLKVADIALPPLPAPTGYCLRCGKRYAAGSGAGRRVRKLFCSGACWLRSEQRAERAAAIDEARHPPPTPAEITERATAIRASWSRQERHERLRPDWRSERWALPVLAAVNAESS
jgi:hypothetical protein